MAELQHAGATYSGKAVEVHSLEVSADANGKRGWAFWDDDRDEYIVETFDGLILNVPEANLKEYQYVLPEDGGFDALWTAESADSAGFTALVANALQAKGYCVVSMPTADEERRKAMQSAKDRADYIVPRPELEEAYLGRSPKSRIAWLDEDRPLDAVKHYSQGISDLSGAVAAVSQDLLGFRSWGNSGTLLRMPLASAAQREALALPAIDEDAIADGAIEQHLDFIQRRRLCLMYVVSGKGGSVELYPTEGSGWEGVQLPTAKDKVLIFRHDAVAYAYKAGGPDDVVVQSWVITEPQELRIDSIQGEQAGMERFVGGAAKLPHEHVHFMAANCRYPGAAHGHQKDWLAYCTQTDCYLCVPVVRFDMDLYYVSDAEQFASGGKSVTKHCGFLADQEWINFDNSFFGISDNVAVLLPPCQRVCLETSYEMLVQGGHTMKSLSGHQMCIVIADIGLDWDSFYGCQQVPEAWLQANFQGTHSSAARFAQTLGVTGSVTQVDTACSASMVSANLVYAAMRQHDLKGSTEGLFTGHQNILTPWTFIGLSAAGMVGRGGRCLAFDQSANGFARGEGSGGVFMRVSTDAQDIQDRLCCMTSGFINQDGRSASLTAPNGPSQQAVMRNSFRDSGVSPHECVITENHGTGTALGDPIECGSVRSVFRGRYNPIPVNSGKSHMGHLEPSAGSIGIIKTMCSLIHACNPPNVHLRQLNAHIEDAGFPGFFMVEKMDFPEEYNYGGANGFGFGGTNARVDLWARRLHRVRKGPEVGGAAGSPGRQLTFMDRLDFVAVPCPRCLGPMCWLCGMAVPADVRAGKHHCKVIRDEFASYDYCSACHEQDGGGYQLAQPEEDFGGHTRLHGKVYLVGTWNAWSRPLEMEHSLEGTTDDVYEAEIALGETCLEQFHLRLPSGDVFHPEVRMAGPDVHAVGPARAGAQKHWLVDGRRDGVEAGTVYRIRFVWGNSLKKVSWTIAEQSQPSTALASYQHVYYIVSSMGRWYPIEMKRDASDPGLWQISGRMPLNGEAEFFFIRDKDDTQMIYPLIARPTEASVPVMGPDEGGLGKRWLALATADEMLTVQLHVKSGRITVSAFTDTMGRMDWESSTGRSRRVYSVTSSWNSWGFSQMDADEDDPDVHRCSFIIGPDGFEEFRIAVNRNKSATLHPTNNGEAPGRGFTIGPDDEGQQKNWHIFGPPGAMLEVTLNLGASDRCRMVTCAPC